VTIVIIELVLPGPKSSVIPLVSLDYIIRPLAGDGGIVRPSLEDHLQLLLQQIGDVHAFENLVNGHGR
jgi:hypothetical protein